MRSRSILFYLAVGFLIMGIMMEGADGRRKILQGRKTITRYYYRKLAIPAWSIVLLSGIAMLIAGGGLYVGLKKFVIDSVNVSEGPTYQPAMSDEV